MTLLIGLMCWAVASDNEKNLVPDIASVEKQVLDYRQSLHRGHVIYKQKTHIKSTYKPRFDRVTTIWFDGKKILNDDLFRYSDEADNAPLHREVKCRNCEKEGYWVYFNDKKFSQGELAVSMNNMALNPDPEAFGVVHPRLLGMVLERVPNLATSRAHLESVIGRPDRDNLQIPRAHLKEQECWQLTYKLNNATFRVWISPSQGPSVVRIEGEQDFAGEHIADSFESELHQFEPSGLWYPQSVVYERRINGESVEKEVTEVQVLSLNEPVAPETFTLAGMNIPVDKPVTVSDNREKGSGLKYWNGKDLITKTKPHHSPLQNRSNPSTRRWLLIVNAVFFALLAVFLFWRRWRRTTSA